MATDDPSSAPPGAEAEEIEATPDPAAPEGSIPQDADDTRGVHFRRLLRSPVTLVITVVLAVVAIAAVAGFFLAVLVVFIIASCQAKEDFFNAYATGRGLNRFLMILRPP